MCFSGLDLGGKDWRLPSFVLKCIAELADKLFCQIKNRVVTNGWVKEYGVTNPWVKQTCI